MADITNNFPSWGETGTLPADGFFYEGGDQVNEKHLDALWNNLDLQVSELITGIEDRVKELRGDSLLDGGLDVSTGSGTREVDITASTEGAYVDGQQTGSTSATTLTLSSTGSSRTDSIWVDTAGQVGKTEGTTSVADDKHKIAEVDVASDDSLTIRNTGHRVTRHWAADDYDAGQVPGGTQDGDLWYDEDADDLNARVAGSWRTVFTADGNETMESDLDMGDFSVINVESLVSSDSALRIDTDGGGTSSVDLYDAANAQIILEANEGGNVGIPNGSLTVSGSGSFSSLTATSGGATLNGDLNFDDNAGLQRFGSQYLTLYGNPKRLDFEGSELHALGAIDSAVSIASGNSLNLNDSSPLIDPQWIEFGGGNALLDSPPSGGDRNTFHVTGSNGPYPYDNFENLVIQGRTDKGDVVITNGDGGGGTEPYLSANYNGNIQIYGGKSIVLSGGGSLFAEAENGAEVNDVQRVRWSTSQWSGNQVRAETHNATYGSDASVRFVDDNTNPILGFHTALHVDLYQDLHDTGGRIYDEANGDLGVPGTITEGSYT